MVRAVMTRLIRLGLACIGGTLGPFFLFSMLGFKLVFCILFSLLIGFGFFCCQLFCMIDEPGDGREVLMPLTKVDVELNGGEKEP
tara:strand:- start:658 stop:912 length:255 start_codon:yes stop_codon:yes gene_type:complete